MRFIMATLTLCGLFFVSGCANLNKNRVLYSSRHDIYQIREDKIVYQGPDRLPISVGHIVSNDEIEGYFIISPKLMGELGSDLIQND